ncbi:hypothetical protein Tco_1572177, partial [Tanacetum coccineum]
SDSKNDAEDKTNDETCLMAQSSNEVTLNSYCHSDDASSLDNDSMQIEYDSLCEIEIACKSCEELKSENAKLNETQVKFDKSANSLREILNNQKLPSCKIGLGFDDSKASTSKTKNISFVGSSAEKATNISTIKVNGSTLPGSDFVITRKKLIHNSIDESKKPSLKPSPKSGICYIKTESRLKTPPP